MGSGSGTRRRPRRGSLQFWPRVKAKRMYPKIRSWTTKSKPKLLGFAGYKAGMTHVLALDNRPASSTKGEKIKIPVTVVETPDLRVLSLRLYAPFSYGSRVISELWADGLSADLSRRLVLPKKRSAPDAIKKMEEALEKATDVRVLVHTQPKQTAFGKKKPDVFEMGVGGSDVKAKFEYAKEILGKEISLSNVFKDGDMLDIHAVTTGKGFQGSVKRFGVSILHRKSHSAGRRKVGTLGNWDAKTWRVPHPGQMGFHNRTEYSKQLLKIGTLEDKANPDGGFVNYGLVKGKFALIAGSVPGPKKRLIRFTHSSRVKKTQVVPEEITISTRSQQ